MDGMKTEWGDGWNGNPFPLSEQGLRNCGSIKSVARPRLSATVRDYPRLIRRDKLGANLGPVRIVGLGMDFHSNHSPIQFPFPTKLVRTEI